VLAGDTSVQEVLRVCRAASEVDDEEAVTAAL
jgi:hypothetical protein